MHRHLDSTNYSEGGVGHDGDAGHIFDAIELVQKPVGCIERRCIEYLRNVTRGNGVNHILAHRTGKATRVHEVTKKILVEIQGERKSAVNIAAFVGVAIGILFAVLESILVDDLLAYFVNESGPERGGRERRKADDARQNFFDTNEDIMVLRVCIFLSSVAICGIVEWIILIVTMLRKAGSMAAILGLDFSQKDDCESGFTRAVVRAVLDAGNSTQPMLGVVPGVSTANCCHNISRCRLRCVRYELFMTNAVLRLVLRPLGAKIISRATVPYLAVPAFALLNAYVVDYQMRRTFSRMLGLPAAVEIMEELLRTAHKAKKQLYAGGKNGRKAKWPHWASSDLRNRLKDEKHLSPKLTVDRCGDKTSHLLFSAQVTKVLAAPDCYAVGQALYKHGRVPDPGSAELMVLCRTVFGSESEAGATVLRAWLEDKQRLMIMRRKCCALEPEGWDQLRRCIACLVIDTRSWDPIRELVLAYAVQEVEGDLINPLVPEWPPVPLGDYMDDDDVGIVLETQSKLRLEDRELIFAIVLLISIVAGDMTDSTCKFLIKLHLVSLGSAPTDGPRPDCFAEVFKITEAKALAKDFHGMKRAVFFRDIINLLAGNSVTKGMKTPSQVELRLLVGLKADHIEKQNQQTYGHYQLLEAHPRSLGDEHYERFSRERQQLNSYNILIFGWSVVSFSACTYILAISDKQLVQAYGIIGFNIFQIATSLVGFMSVHKQQVTLMKWYFISHFVEVVVTAICVTLTVAYHSYIRVYIDRNWDQDWMTSLQTNFCAEEYGLSNIKSEKCEDHIIEHLQVLIIICMIGSTVVFLLLVLSTRSAMAVIPELSVDTAHGATIRKYAMLWLTCAVNFMIGVTIVYMGLYKMDIWPNPKESTTTAYYDITYIYDPLVVVIGGIGIFQSICGMIGVRARAKFLLKLHNLLVFVMIVLCAYVAAAGWLNKDNWHSDHVSSFAFEEQHGAAACITRCSGDTKFAIIPEPEPEPEPDSEPDPAPAPAPGDPVDVLEPEPEPYVDLYNYSLCVWHNISVNDDVEGHVIELDSHRTFVQDMWEACDEKCMTDAFDCEHRKYRQCAVDINSTLIDCTCRDHVDCVVNLKAGFAVVVDVLSSIMMVQIVLMFIALFCGQSLASNWEVFFAKKVRELNNRPRSEADERP
eukprot:SAG11_NODE_1220_length_5493_cov_17.313311_1_plen_1152_part_00